MHHPDVQLADTSHPAGAVVLELPPSVIQPVVPVVASLDASDQPTPSQESTSRGTRLPPMKITPHTQAITPETADFLNDFDNDDDMGSDSGGGGIGLDTIEVPVDLPVYHDSSSDDDEEEDKPEAEAENLSL